MKQIVQLEIEEFERGAWVADAISLDAFDGSFDFAGETWTGAKVSERFDFERYHTRIIGGAGKLSARLNDKYYDGSVSLKVAAGDACREAGETLGDVKAGVFLSTFERLRGPSYAALDAIAEAFDLLWWIGRDGKVQLQAARPGGDAKGNRVASDVDSVLLRSPEGVTVGASYDDRTIHHVRWSFSSSRFEARAYFLPFIFRAPTDNRYDALTDARVDTDNGDGTIDVIVGGRYGLKKVKLFCGVPHSKVKCDAGDLVTVGYFAGDPQKPYAVAMAQDTSATKAVARKDDSVVVTLTSTLLLQLAASFVSPVGPCVYTPTPAPPPPDPPPPGIDVTGKITSGSNRLKVGDA